MAFDLPIEDLLKPVSREAPCGVLDQVNEGQIGALEGAVRSRPAITQFKDNVTKVLREAQEPDWAVLDKAARGLFLGGRIPDLARESGNESEVEVKPVKHLLPSLVLTRAGLEFDGLKGFLAGITLM